MKPSLTFKPTLVPTIVAALVFVCLLGLGRWQLQRMHEKQALFAAFTRGSEATLPLALATGRLGAGRRYQHVSASGHYESGRQILLDSMTHEGRVGYRVLTPFVADTGDTVLVDRGWLAAPSTREVLPDIRVTEDTRTITGRLDLPPGRGIDIAPPPDLAAGAWPRVMTYPKMEQLRAAQDRPLFPYILLLDAEQPAGYVRAWQPSTFPPERHLGYAITWFTLAATLAVLYFISQTRRRG